MAAPFPPPLRGTPGEHYLCVDPLSAITAGCRQQPKTSRLTRNAGPVLAQGRASVCDAGPTLSQHWTRVNRDVASPG